LHNPAETNMVNEEARTPEKGPTEILAVDRRGAERYPCSLLPFWRLSGEEPFDVPPASVRDVSATGIGLRVAQPLELGSVLILTLQAGDHRLSRPLPARVMHATRQEDGGWLLGCRFVRPLSPQDLLALLGED
jgi:hypothetical protein